MRDPFRTARRRLGVALLALLLWPTVLVAQGGGVFEGRLVARDGTPLPDVRVYEVVHDDVLDDLEIEPEWEHGVILQHFPFVVSDADGRFVLPLGSPPDYVDPDEPQRVLLRGPGVASQLLDLDPARSGPQRIVMQREGRLALQVFGRHREPRPGVHACIHVEWFDDDEFDDEDRYEMLGATFCALSDADGWVELVGLPAGSVLIALYDPLGDEHWVEDVEVKRGKRRVLRPVTFDEGWRLSARVRDLAGEPIVGARALVTEAGYELDEYALHLPAEDPLPLLDPATVRVAHTNEEGLFLINGLFVDELDIVVSAPGYEPVFRGDVEVGGRKQFRLAPEGTLLVRVRDADGAPLADARVVATREPEFDVHELLLPVLAGDALAARRPAHDALPGDRLVVGTHPVTTVLEVSAPGFERRRIIWTAAPDVAEPQLEVALAPAAALHGRALSYSGAPLVGQEILLHPDDGVERSWRPYRSVTDAEGRYAFRDLPAGDWTLATPWPLRSPSREFALAAGEDRDVDLRPRGGGSALAGRVLARTGVPVVGLRLSLREASGDAKPGRRVAGAVTDADGRFALRDLEDGAFVLHSSLLDTPVQLAVDEQRELSLTLERPVIQVRGRLLVDGEPVPGVVHASGRWGDALQPTGSPEPSPDYAVIAYAHDAERKLQLLLGARRETVVAGVRTSYSGGALLLLDADAVVERDIELRVVTTPSPPAR